MNTYTHHLEYEVQQQQQADLARQAQHNRLVREARASNRRRDNRIHSIVRATTVVMTQILRFTLRVVTVRATMPQQTTVNRPATTR